MRSNRWLKREQRVMVVRLLMEGMSIAAVSRMVGITNVPIHRLRKSLAAVCSDIHDSVVRGVFPQRVQADECWTKVIRARWTRPEAEAGINAAWVWSAVDQDSRMLLAWHVGKRDQESARTFLADLHRRCEGGYQLITDGCFMYPGAVKEVFMETGVQHVVLNTGNARAIGYSSYAHRKDQYTTNHVERQNFDMRSRLAAMRRSSHTFARSFATLRESIAVYCVYYNFVRSQKGLGGTPAMLANLTDAPWTVESLIERLEATEPEIKRLPPKNDGTRVAKWRASWNANRAAKLAG